MRYSRQPGSPPPPDKETITLAERHRREMLRIQTQSICGRRPIFETLDRTSQLAETVVARAYEIAIADVCATHKPQCRH